MADPQSQVPATSEAQRHDQGFLAKAVEFVEGIGEKVESALAFGKPSAHVSGFHLPSITLEQADVVVDVLVHNPNPIPIPMVNIHYLIESDGRELVSGTIPDAGTIHAHGSETIKIPLTLIYKEIHDTYEDIKPGQVIPYRVKVDLSADVPVIGKLTLPLEKTGEIPIPYKPDVDVDKVEFDHLSFEETNATLHLKVDNKNEFELGLNGLDFEFVLADVPVASATLGSSAKISKCGAGVVELPIAFKPKEMGSAVWDIIRGRGAGYSISGKLDADTPFGPINLPFSKEGGNTRLQKKRTGEDDDADDRNSQD